MGLRISTNVPAISAQRALEASGTSLKQSYTRLASGKRITTAGDDAAGLSISENLRATIQSTKQAERNAQDGISFVQVAEGGMHEISNLLIRMREISIQAASDTISDREREFIDAEFKELISEIDRISNATTFTGTPLLNGQAEKDVLEIQVGTSGAEADRIGFEVNSSDVRAATLGVDGASALTTDDARAAIDLADEALVRVNGSRARLGATSNKLHSTVRSLAVSKENLSEAYSRIADADVAAVTSDLVRDNILQQAGIAVLAQANARPKMALNLL